MNKNAHNTFTDFIQRIGSAGYERLKRIYNKYTFDNIQFHFNNKKIFSCAKLHFGFFINIYHHRTYKPWYAN